MRETGFRQRLGVEGEALAARELERLGLAILAHRYRTRFGEIDLIAQDGRTVVFVEVKARRSARFGSAAEAVPVWKQRRLAAMALDYLAWSGRLKNPCRFDVIAIDGFGGERQTVRHIPHAFAI
jgi:putative endonuclease